MPNEIFGRPVLLDVQKQAGLATGTLVATSVLRASALMQAMTWDTSDSLTKIYNRTRIARVGQVRDLNSDFAPKFAGGDVEVPTKLAILGDSFEYDRVLGNVDTAKIEAQIEAMGPAVANKFSDLMINGSRTANALEFDGLSAVAEAIGGNAVQTGLDLTLGDTGNNLAFRRNYARVVKAVRQMVAMGLKPVVIGNTDALGAFDLAAELVAANTIQDYYNRQTLTTIAGGALLLDAGMANVYNPATTVDSLGRTVYEVLQEEVIPSDTAAGVVTDLYVVGLGLNGVTGLTLDGYNGRSPARFRTSADAPGAVRRAEVELVAGLAVVDERAVVKFSDVKVG